MTTLRRNLELRFKMTVLRRVWRREGDFNRCVLDDLASGSILAGKPCFAFLDPNSTQLPWSTVKALASHRAGSDDGYKIELLILFNTEQAFIRMLPREQGPEYISSGTAAALDRVMGGRDVWWDLNDASFNGAVLTRRYRERLIGLGYKHVSVVPINDPVSGRRQYFMVHASDHPAAKELIVWGEQAIAKSQGRHALFDVKSLFDAVDPEILDEDDGESGISAPE